METEAFGDLTTLGELARIAEANPDKKVWFRLEPDPETDERFIGPVLRILLVEGQRIWCTIPDGIHWIGDKALAPAHLLARRVFRSQET